MFQSPPQTIRGSIVLIDQIQGFLKMAEQCSDLLDGNRTESPHPAAGTQCSILYVPDAKYSLYSTILTAGTSIKVVWAILSFFRKEKARDSPTSTKREKRNAFLS